MQYITDDYKEEMHLAWRGKSSINAQIGLINSDAQNNASITSSFSGSETHLYDNTAMGVVTSTEADGSSTFSAFLLPKLTKREITEVGSS